MFERQRDQRPIEGSGKTVGFYCIPVVEGARVSFMKCAIKERYTCLGKTQSVFDKDRHDVAWGLMANLSALVEHMPWISVMDEIRHIHGTKSLVSETEHELDCRLAPGLVKTPPIDFNVLKKFPSAATLEMLHRTVLQCECICLFQSPEPPHLFIAAAGRPPYAEALIAELSGKTLHRPQTVVLSHSVSAGHIAALCEQWNVADISGAASPYPRSRERLKNLLETLGHWGTKGLFVLAGILPWLCLAGWLAYVVLKKVFGPVGVVTGGIIVVVGGLLAAIHPRTRKRLKDLLETLGHWGINRLLGGGLLLLLIVVILFVPFLLWVAYAVLKHFFGITGVIVGGTILCALSLYYFSETVQTYTDPVVRAVSGFSRRMIRLIYPRAPD